MSFNLWKAEGICTDFSVIEIIYLIGKCKVYTFNDKCSCSYTIHLTTFIKRLSKIIIIKK